MARRVSEASMTQCWLPKNLGSYPRDQQNKGLIIFYLQGVAGASSLSGTGLKIRDPAPLVRWKIRDPTLLHTFPQQSISVLGKY